MNHNLRGAESLGDAEFVRALAGQLGLPVHQHELDLAGVRGQPGAGRARRPGWSFSTRNWAGPVTRVALGHTRSDQAETVLFRFLRGSGATGLAAIRPVTTRGMVRPLLDVDRAEVEAYLAGTRYPVAGGFHQCDAWISPATASATSFCRNWRAIGIRR